MNNTKAAVTAHPSESELSDYLNNALTGENKKKIEDHIACCRLCLDNIVSAHEVVKLCGMGKNNDKGKVRFMKKINIYLVLACISFILSFTVTQYFMQFLIATLLLGTKWIVDAKSTRMLVMIYDAWKKGGEKEASRVLNSFEQHSKNRL